MSAEHGFEEKKKSVVDKVMDGIIADIIEGKINPGDKLPTEIELCDRYDAGRNSVREAIKKLEANGIVYIKRADGTFVSENYNQKMLDPMLYSIILHKNSWQDFVELRSVIDIGTLEVIINNAHEGDNYREFKRILANMEKEIYEDEPSIDKIMECDAEFHAAVAAIAHNPQLVTITDYITKLTAPSRKQAIKNFIEKNEEDNFIKLHRQMLDVIEHKRSELIVKTVLDHYVYWKK
ncbi:MAG: FadR family transcriptional regulator [Butyrivibrio sp.]|uniref:FadR/GntR family transcriptional regulator n=1 Tax=Butyrivibrio sp. TaxID=28121 RepID=UPI001B2594E1|nr:GntR family transcriptional regulator [Butyrivibrio sp.]MBO6240991.1 FadR family transcriptional regulator [Butyrivibrio sp.]